MPVATAVLRSGDHALGDGARSVDGVAVAGVLLPQEQQHRREHSTELQPDGEARARGRLRREALVVRRARAAARRGLLLARRSGGRR